MNIRLITAIILVLFQTGISVFANNNIVNDTTHQSTEIFDPEQLLRLFVKDTIPEKNITTSADSTLKGTNENSYQKRNYNHNQYAEYDIKERINQTSLLPIDTLILLNNPFFIDLVYRDKAFDFDWRGQLKPYSYFYESTYDSIHSSAFKKITIPTVDNIISELRTETYRRNMLSSPAFFAFRADALPSINDLKNRILKTASAEKLMITGDETSPISNGRKLVVEKVKISRWTKKANSMLQFSQYYVSENWHQGGSDYISILGILNGQLNYDNKKNTQWENNAEWRLGFNSVENGVRLFNTNEDIFKVNSKLGIRASGNFFYSSSFDFSAQLFKNYKSVTSEDLKAAFLTPVRMNIGVGMDYKYKKMFSLMVAPISYKYVYAHKTEIPVTSFGIPEGEKHLSQLGSSFRAQASYSPVREIQLDTKLSFYTNYEKVEVDWEIVTNFTVNRYLSTRLAINPRYDNTVILPNNEKAKIQFKELLSFGFSYRFLN
ncbi:MAG: DUF3078 domain-containing protein [Paludibacteraceae bacterium]|nr:DUF3078 domain-containing protein [Paludibacteraceae bacterium]